jgi:hypothetical protein
MIDKEIEKQMFWMKFESKQVDEQTVYLNLRFSRFIEGIEFLDDSLFECIAVILLTECIFGDVYRLWPCFDPSLNPISDLNPETTFYFEPEVMIRNIELICLIKTNDQTKCELSVSEKQQFFHQFCFVKLPIFLKC